MEGIFAIFAGGKLILFFMNMQQGFMLPDWAKGTNCAITVCDAECKILYMNDKARATFAKYGDLIGADLLGHHNERSVGIIKGLLAGGGVNCYTIEKGGVRKMIYQTAWRAADGTVGGLVEISMELPAGELPHYVRD